MARMATPAAGYGGSLRCQRQERQYQTSDFDHFHIHWPDIAQVCNVKQPITISWRNWLGVLIRKQAILELARRRNIYIYMNEEFCLKEAKWNNKGN